MRLQRVRFMVRRVMILVLSAPAVGAVSMAAVHLNAVHAAAQPRVSLLQTLSEWKYPGSNMLGGASMSDGGNPQVQSVKCQAILTTPDPIEKVIEFYSEKTGTVPATGRQHARTKVKDADARSVSTQDDSQGRPVTLRVIVVNKADTATTLVISRANSENETHIAWLHFLRLEGKR
jgi:hypothetical protein